MYNKCAVSMNWVCLWHKLSEQVDFASEKCLSIFIQGKTWFEIFMPVTSLEIKCKVEVQECKATKNKKKETFVLNLSIL